MKKKIIISIILLISFFWIGKRLHWYIKSDHNNLSITIINNNSWIHTDSILLPISVKLYIDNILVYENDSLIEPYNFVKNRVNIGYHNLRILINSSISENCYFFVFPMKWIIVEYPINENDENTILITTHSDPPNFM